MNSYIVLLVGVFCVAIANAQISTNVNDISFIYYSSPSSRHQIVHDNVNSLAASPFKQGAHTVLIVDGFLSNETSPMSQDMKNAFIAKSSNYNVIVVDWGKLSGAGAKLDNLLLVAAAYSNVLKNVGRVGERLADFINFLRVNRGVQFNNVHIVGHSLGAHNAGAAGNNIKDRFNGLIGRITGLDPAGPFFNFQVDANKRLYKTDAAFVDIYHTNRGTLGDSSHQTGDINVYVNGGDNQPGCEEADQSGFAGFCSHSYSWQLFSAAFRRNFNACPCSGTDCQCKDCSLTCSNPVVLGPNTPSSSAGAYHIRAIL